jgi:hypothetical protein
VLCAVWALFQLLVALVGGSALVSDLAGASRNASENRAPAAHLVLAALTTFVALIGLGASLQYLFGRQRRISARGGLLLAAATLLVLCVAVLVGFASDSH